LIVRNMGVQDVETVIDLDSETGFGGVPGVA